MGKIEKALESYDRALKINPNYQSALRNRERCLKILKLKEREISLSSLEKQVKIKSNRVTKKKVKKKVKKKE
jgi:tetratricopeptide (TPR) repeat protein